MKMWKNLVEDLTAVTAIWLIYQANMDGTSLEIVVNETSELAGFVIDREYARLYWTYIKGTGLWEYDIDGKISRQLHYPSVTSQIGIHFASGGAIYFEKVDPPGTIYRGTADGSNFTEIYRYEKGEASRIIATPGTESKANCSCRQYVSILNLWFRMGTMKFVSKNDALLRRPRDQELSFTDRKNNPDTRLNIILPTSVSKKTI